MAVEKGEIQESWLIFKDHILSLEHGPLWYEKSWVKVAGGLLDEQEGLQRTQT